MTVPPELFEDSYLYFYGGDLEQRSDADAALIARLLALREGARVLDVPCGHGRIAGRLADRGYEVVGIDYTEHFLELARERWPKVRFEHGDMRSLEADAEFDAVVNWFTSFGYFDRETNDAVLRSFARALRPDGQLLLECHNPGRLKRLIEQIPAPQLVERLKRAGFGDVRLFGAGGGAFEEIGPRLIAVAQRRLRAPRPSKWPRRVLPPRCAATDGHVPRAIAARTPDTDRAGSARADRAAAPA